MKWRKLGEFFSGRYLVPDTREIDLREFQNYISKIDKNTKVKSCIENIVGDGFIRYSVPETLGGVLRYLKEYGYLEEEDFLVKHQLYEGVLKKQEKHYFDVFNIKRVSNGQAILKKKIKASFSYVLEV